MALATIELLYGQPAPLLATFRNADAALADPTTVRWRVRPPSGDEVLVEASGTIGGHAYEVTNPSTGLHRLQFVPWLAGRWRVRVESFGTIQEAAEFLFVVTPSGLTTASLTPP